MKNLPFTTEEFFEVIRNYNDTFFPAQLIIFALGLAVFGYLHVSHRFKSKFIGYFLGAIWIWSGFAYHLVFFTTINKAAYIFGLLFIIQGIFFIIETLRNRLEFERPDTAASYIGYFFVLFGILIYPLVSYYMYDVLTDTISLGLPCPTTIATFGLLILSRRTMKKYLVIIPSLWALIGTSAAVNFGVYPDFVMPLAAIVADLYILGRKKAIYV